MGNLLVRSVSSRQQLHPRLDNEDGAGDPSESMREGDGQGEKLQAKVSCYAHNDENTNPTYLGLIQRRMRVRGEARQVEVRLDLQRMRILLRDQHRHIELVREVERAMGMLGSTSAVASW